MQRLGQVPEGSGANAEFRFRKVPVQRFGEVTESFGAEVRSGFEGSGTEVRLSCRGFWCGA